MADFHSLQYKIDELAKEANDLKYKMDADFRKMQQDFAWKLDKISKLAEELKYQLQDLERQSKK